MQLLPLAIHRNAQLFKFAIQVGAFEAGFFGDAAYIWVSVLL